MDTDSHAHASAPFSSSASDRDWTIREALRSGVDGLRRHWKVLLPASLLVTCLGEGVSWALTSAGELLGGTSQHALQFANGGFAVLLSLLLTAGFIRITLDTARGRTPSLRSFVSSAGSVLGLLAVYLLTTMAPPPRWPRTPRIASPIPGPR